MTMDGESKFKKSDYGNVSPLSPPWTTAVVFKKRKSAYKSHLTFARRHPRGQGAALRMERGEAFDIVG